MTDVKPLYDVVGIGRAYIDVIGQGSEALLERFGIPLGTGRYFSLEDIEEIVASLKDVSVYPGGAAPNTIAGLAALGAKTGLFGKAARDERGRVFLNDLKARGIVAVCPPIDEGAPMSGTCVCVLSEGGERSFALNQGCVDAFTQEDFDAFDMNDTACFLVYTKLLTDSACAPLLADLIRRAASSRAKVALSLSEVRDWSVCASIVQTCLLPAADLVIGNGEELAAFYAQSGPLSDSDILVIETQGSAGVTAWLGGKETHVPVCPAPVFANTLGAGDQFLAGFLKGWLEGFPLERSLRLGARCAAEIVACTEARPQAGLAWDYNV